MACGQATRGESIDYDDSADKWIRDRAINDAMIEPFVEAQRRDGCILRPKLIWI